MFNLGSNTTSRYSDVALAAALLVCIALGVVWRQRVMHGDRDARWLRRVLTIASVWAGSVSALALVVYSAHRSYLRLHPNARNGFEGAVIAGGLFLSPVGLLGVFASGSGDGCSC